MINIIRAEKNRINEILNIYNTVTKELLAKEIYQWEYPWKIEVIEELIKNIYTIYEKNILIGSFVVKRIDNDIYCMKSGDYYIEKIAILPEYQGGGKIVNIMEFIYDLKAKTSYDYYLDCWSGNDRLKEIYNKFGIYMGEYNEEDYYISIFKIER